MAKLGRMSLTSNPYLNNAQQQVLPEDLLRRPTLRQILFNELDSPKDDSRWARMKCVPPTVLFLTGMCYKVAFASKPTLEQYWELQALYHVANDEKVIDWSEAAEVDKVYSQVSDRMDPIIKESRFSQTYAYWITEIYEYVYSSHLESVSEWRTISQMIDEQRGDLLSGEMEKLTALIDQHSTEITNAAFVQQGRWDLVAANKLKCNYAGMDRLAEEVEEFTCRPQSERSDWENDFLWSKITLAERYDIITMKESNYLHKKLNQLL